MSPLAVLACSSSCFGSECTLQQLDVQPPKKAHPSLKSRALAAVLYRPFCRC